jgi:hypothetical protein
VIVVKVVPFRRVWQPRVNLNDYSVLIKARLEPRNVSVTEKLSRLRYELGSLVLNVLDHVLGNWGISNALEKLNTLFSFEVFEMAIFLDKVLLLLCNSLILESERHRGVQLFSCLTNFNTSVGRLDRVIFQAALAHAQ